jgi:flagellar biosynthetic protein FlhB
MADQEQNRSEAATPYKLQEARKRGQVAKSLELNSLLAVLALLVVLYVWGRAMMRNQLSLDALVFAQAGALSFEAGAISRWLAEILLRTLYLLTPMFMLVAVVAVLGSMLQTGPVFTTFPLKPDMERLNPIAGFKRMMGWRLVFEMCKNVVKLALFSAAIYFVIRSIMPAMLLLLQTDPVTYGHSTLDHAIDIVFKLAWVLFAIVIADVIYIRWSYFDKLKMSRREVREEVKHREGDPRIRARLRELRREALKRSKALRRLPEADVLITNPTHVAVALLYRRDEMAAPMVIAKGADELAEHMKALARRHRVPIVENRGLARALFARTDVEQRIPDALFAPVARLLVWVYALRDARTGVPA